MNVDPFIVILLAALVIVTAAGTVWLRANRRRKADARHRITTQLQRRSTSSRPTASAAKQPYKHNNRAAQTLLTGPLAASASDTGSPSGD